MTDSGTPAVAGTSQWGPLADWPKRVIATLVDAVVYIAGYIVLAIVGVILGAVSDVLAALVVGVGYLALTAYALYIAFMTGQRGASPGKRLTGLKVVKLADGQVIGGGMGIVRQIAHFVDSICLIGYLFPLWDPMRQTLADKIIGTVVLSDQEKEPFSMNIFKL